MAGPTGSPKPTPLVGEETWSPAVLVISSETGAGCGRVTVSTNVSFMSLAAADNGRWVMVPYVTSVGP